MIAKEQYLRAVAADADQAVELELLEACNHLARAIRGIAGRRLRVDRPAAAFVGIFFFDIPFPIIIFGAAVVGLIGAWSGASAFRGPVGHDDDKDDERAIVDSLLGNGQSDHARPAIRRAVRVASVWLALRVSWSTSC